MSTVFAIGHCLGPFHPEPEEAFNEIRIRLGSMVVSLGNPDELLAWTVAHSPHRPEEYRSRLAERVGPAAPEVEARMVGLGLLAVVEPGGVEEFAGRHRMRPLLTGVGEVAPGEYAIVALGRVRALVSGPLYELWCRAGGRPTLWGACEDVAREQNATPAQILDRFLNEGHGLLGAGAAYLDVV